jgi:hypothetical protein
MNGPYDVVDTGKRLQVEYGEFVEVRSNVMTNDVDNPVNFDNCHDLTGWEYVDVYVKVSGSNPSWDITPIFGIDDGSFTFFEGETITVTKNEIRRLQIFGAPCLYFKCLNMSGINPVVDYLSIKPVNLRKM